MLGSKSVNKVVPGRCMLDKQEAFLLGFVFKAFHDKNFKIWKINGFQSFKFFLKKIWPFKIY